MAVGAEVPDGAATFGDTGAPEQPVSSKASRMLGTATLVASLGDFVIVSAPFSNGPGFQVQTARRKMVRPTGGDDATQALVPVTGLDPYTVARYDGAGGPNALHRPKI
jgi:hypothetical protein